MTSPDTPYPIVTPALAKDLHRFKQVMSSEQDRWLKHLNTAIVQLVMLNGFTGLVQPPLVVRRQLSTEFIEGLAECLRRDGGWTVSWVLDDRSATNFEYRYIFSLSAP
ncbi:hypothetical protein LUCX_187 [Xanthomonas phage vB_XciM_LucasX]|nr:hypothetical protein LUCX_187 [Xanthomonas phage vB_XciM_LucasX]